MVGRYPTNKLIGRNPLPQQQPKPPFTVQQMPAGGPFGITHRFQRLFRSEGYVGYVLLTLSPLYSSEDFRARLACLIHTASVRSEPGSNPSVDLNWLCSFWSPNPTFDCRNSDGGESNTLALNFKSHPVFKEPLSALVRTRPRGAWRTADTPTSVEVAPCFTLKAEARPAGFHRILGRSGAPCVGRCGVLGRSRWRRVEGGE